MKTAVVEQVEDLAEEEGEEEEDVRERFQVEVVVPPCSPPSLGLSST